MGVDRLAFGRLVKRERERQGLSLARLGYRIGELPDGTLLDGSAVRSLENGGRAIEDDRELYERVVSVLELDRDEAHAALWPLPPGITLENIRELRRDSERRAARALVAVAPVAQQKRGHDSTADPLHSDQGEPGTLYFPFVADRPAA